MSSIPGPAGGMQKELEEAVLGRLGASSITEDAAGDIVISLAPGGGRPADSAEAPTPDGNTPEQDQAPQVQRGQARSLSELAATGRSRRRGEDPDFEGVFAASSADLDDDEDDEDDDPPAEAAVTPDPVQETAEQMAQMVLAAGRFTDAVLAAGLDAGDLKREIESRFGLPGKLLDACASFAGETD